MKPNPKFQSLPKHFWADVKLISQEVGYTERKTSQIKIPSFAKIQEKYKELHLKTDHIFTGNYVATEYGQQLIDYFTYRADVLNNTVQHHLMNKEQAKTLFEKLHAELEPTCHIPMNKQSGDKKTHMYLTGIVNMLIAANVEGAECDYNPGSLTTITFDGMPLRTLSRRVDGAFPSTVNPIAIWEVKEYYSTTTFGSRVADGVYETLLDGLELEELHQSENKKVFHYLIVDDHFTWWVKGRSYLCRMIDMLNMGYVDQVLFGKEVVNEIPEITKTWVV
jgi:hypothetical protein